MLRRKERQATSKTLSISESVIVSEGKCGGICNRNKIPWVCGVCRYHVKIGPATFSVARICRRSTGEKAKGENKEGNDGKRAHVDRDVLVVLKECRVFLKKGEGEGKGGRKLSEEREAGYMAIYYECQRTRGSNPRPV